MPVKCPNCGSENEYGAYCNRCGRALAKLCPNCGAPQVVPAGPY
jgi:ribosomal protein S27E